MPTYRYKCRSCSIITEKIQKFSDSPLKVCPHCGGNLVKMVSATGGFILKGEGFYANDYKKKPVSCPAKSGNETTAGSEPSSCAECPHQ
ncbi:MAG TPA: hypothetical protein ENO01_00185 [Candidatus Marinimicrobia bacterium]|nr:hypothetical protein [Candidatus Neomarinimicrobiota bacterium]